jgi:hypothetical protein
MGQGFPEGREGAELRPNVRMVSTRVRPRRGTLQMVATETVEAGLGDADA